MGKAKRRAKKPNAAPTRKSARLTRQNTKPEEKQDQKPGLTFEEKEALLNQLAEAQKKFAPVKAKMREFEENHKGRPNLWNFPVVDPGLKNPKSDDQASSSCSSNNDNKNDLDPASAKFAAQNPGEEKQEENVKTRIQGNFRWSKSLRALVPKGKRDSQSQESSNSE